MIEVKTQAELDKALAENPGERIILRGDASFNFRVGESSHVEAWESSHVEAWGSSHVEARGSSHVVAWESSHVEAWGNVFVRAFGAVCKIKASFSVAVMLHAGAKSAGGQKMRAIEPTTPAKWCELHGIEVNKGVATLYKAVRDNYCSSHGFSYTPGTVPVAPDWDGGKAECGGGLHFSPSPAAAKSFDSDATRYLACPVKLKDMRAPKKGDSYPEKTKAKGCCAAVWEVDLYGNAIAEAKQAA